MDPLGFRNRSTVQKADADTTSTAIKYRRLIGTLPLYIYYHQSSCRRMELLNRKRRNFSPWSSKHVKAAGMFSMRHSHQDTDSTWNTTWFSAFWRQRISSTVTATNAAFVNRILQRDSVFQQDGPSIAKAPPYPRFYNYDPKLNRRSCNYRNPHSTRDKES